MFSKTTSLIRYCLRILLTNELDSGLSFHVFSGACWSGSPLFFCLLKRCSARRSMMVMRPRIYGRAILLSIRLHEWTGIRCLCRVQLVRTVGQIELDISSVRSVQCMMMSSSSGSGGQGASTSPSRDLSSLRPPFAFVVAESATCNLQLDIVTIAKAVVLLFDDGLHGQKRRLRDPRY